MCYVDSSPRGDAAVVCWYFEFFDKLKIRVCGFMSVPVQLVARARI